MSFGLSAFWYICMSVSLSVCRSVYLSLLLHFSFLTVTHSHETGPNDILTISPGEVITLDQMKINYQLQHSPARHCN